FVDHTRGFRPGTPKLGVRREELRQLLSCRRTAFLRPKNQRTECHAEGSYDGAPSVLHLSLALRLTLPTASQTFMAGSLVLQDLLDFCKFAPYLITLIDSGRLSAETIFAYL